MGKKLISGSPNKAPTSVANLMQTPPNKLGDHTSSYSPNSSAAKTHSASYHPPHDGAAEARVAGSRAQAQVDGLSPREREVLACLVKGMANKVVAHELGISPRTVEVHRANLMDKLGARSLPDLVRIGLAAGM